MLHLAASTFSFEPVEIEKRFHQLSKTDEYARLEGLLVLSEQSLRVHPQKGMAFAREARELAQKLKRPRQEALALYWLSQYQDATGDFVKALHAANSGLSLAEELSDQRLLIRLLLGLSLVLDHVGSYDQALEVSGRALHLAERLGDSRWMANAHMTFGLSLFRLQQYDRARTYYEKARVFLKPMGDFKTESRAINALAYLETMKDPPNHEGALVLYEEALALQRKNGDIKSQSDYLLNMGISHFSLKHYQKAGKCYQESLALRLKLGDKLAVAMVQQNLALLLDATGRREEGQRLLRQAMKAYRDMGARHHWAGALRQEAEYLESVGDYKAALSGYKAFQSLTETLLKEDTAQKLAHVEARHQVEQTKRQIEILEKDLAVKRTRTRLYGLGLMAILVTSLLIYNRYRLKLKSARVIREANRELETLDLIVKEINATETLPGLLKALLENAWRLFPQADRLSILLLDPEENLFQTELALTKNPAEIDAIQGVSLTAEAAKARYTAGQELMDGIYLIQSVGELLAKKGLHEAVCLLVMCIEIEDKGVGYLVLDHLSDPYACHAGDALRLSRMRQHVIHALAKARDLDYLQSLNEQKDAFLGMAAHDLRHPLNGMVLNAQLALEERDPNAIQPRIRQIYQEGLSMSHIIGRFLDVAAIEAGALKAECVPFRWDEIISHRVLRHMDHAKAKHIDLIPLLPVEAIWVVGDGRLMVEVLDNLLSNALKFSPMGRSVRICLIDLEKTVCLRVEDEGPGLTRSDKKRIFGRFAKLSAKPTAGEKSTGLGLHIVKHMVDAMNGRIWVESEPGCGAAFCLELPKGHAVSKNAPTSVSVFKGLKILLAEDDAHHRAMTQTLLERRGACVDAVEDGIQVLEYLDHHFCDWVLLDGNMPRMNGQQTIAEIRRREKEGPWQGRHQGVIALTGSFESTAMMTEWGYDGYLSKPLDLDALGERLGGCPKGLEASEKDPWDRLAQALGDPEAFKDFLTVSVDDLDARKDKIRNARIQNHREELLRHAHDLKSSGALLSFHELSRVAQDLEIRIRDMSWPEVDACIDVIEKELDAAIHQIRDYLVS